ncbi:MAG: bifunctional UDP-N-acetylglucosamine diphosphorylase/glucosamine-1-phosphate N-acetyltransferase GlmU [Burkholderiales bacterium]|nr:bifunctional UDP-N-acetylglucosamine diphosphorylase/glucosamine-1-phosphate N-acetyltransferase GlmU [Burkholderiales bacterium]
MLQIVILAAGKGTRMKSALPKVLHPLAGKSLLGHVLATAATLSPTKTVIVYGHGGEAVPAAFAQQSAAFVLQEPQLGTGHAVQQAIPALADDGTTLVLYGDVPLISTDTLRRVLTKPDTLSVLTVTLDDPTGYGRIVRDAAGRVQRIVEQKDADDATRAIREVNTGIIAAPTARLAAWLGRLSNHNAQREYYLTDVIAMAVADGLTIHTTQPDAFWEVEGINSRDQLARLERIHQGEQAKRLMAGGVTLADPARIDVRGELSCGTDVTIDVGCVFEGVVQIGEDVEIGPYCVIKNSVIESGARIAAYSHLEGAHVGPVAKIGPYARLRPGARLARDVHIGNFVEVKATTIGEGSKANHLAYLGDSEIGRNVNVGAGTITCNYDGANKSKTIIEDDAFIGSDTQLVAPVRVGRGATLGAGTTLTRDAPEGQLTVSRAKQVSIAGWKRPTKKTPA